MNIHQDETIGLIVTRNVQTASIFSSYGIDFFSRGNRTVEVACLEHNVAMPSLLEELWAVKALNGNTPDFEKMNLTALSVYILKNHHRFAEKKVVFIKNTLERLVREYGEDNASVRLLKQTFDDLSVYLTVHMKHEEFIVFPFIQKLTRTKDVKYLSLPAVERPIEAMKEDHEHEVLRLKQISDLTHNYALPKNADYALRITYSAIKEFEEDLKIHMHLENNILFPKAIDLAYSIVKYLN